MAARNEIRELAAREDIRFTEVHVRCPVEVAKTRDSKNLYKRAELGEIRLTGVNDPYEEPDRPHVVADTDKNSPESCAQHIFAHIKKTLP